MEPKHEKSLITQLLLSLSIFSFVFSYYSLRSSSLFRPQDLPANPFNLHSHALNKNYIFLICNALLVFLFKTSGLVLSSSGFDLSDMLHKRVGEGLLQAATKEPAFLQRPKDEEEDEGILNEEETKYQISTESDEELHGIFYDNFEADIEEIHEKESDNCLLVDGIIEEDETLMDEQEVAEEEALSTEELNKKFEEFIRKTKEEIMINEARQLVFVK